MINPLVVTPDTYELITGERRLEAVKLLGYYQVEVREMAVKDAEHQLNLEISENEMRKDFSKSERIDYARRLERVERLRAKERMLLGNSLPSANIGVGSGETREIVAEKMGIGGHETYRKEKFIVDNQEILLPEDFADWDEGKLSTNKAYLQIKKAKEDADNKNVNLELEVELAETQRNKYEDEARLKKHIYISLELL